MIYIGIRPCDATYDKTYWAQNLIRFHESKENNYIGCASGIVIEGYYGTMEVSAAIQFHIQTTRDTKFAHFMNDSHYYIKSLVKKYAGRVFISGGGFWHMPGQYQLPFGEGSYVVFEG